MFDTRPLTSTPPKEEERTELQPREHANNLHVRRVLLAAATRTRNLSVAALVSTSALALLASGLTWSGLGVLGFGTMLYGLLIARDSTSESFLSDLYSLGPRSESNFEILSEDVDPVSLAGLEGDLHTAYQRVLLRRNQLQERIDTGPAILQASVPEAKRISDTLLANAKRLVRRGQRLQAYLQSTKLVEISDSAAMVTLLGANSRDPVAARIYDQVARAKQSQIAAHADVEGLYDRVLAQLILIETTLAGAIASFVKITATDDEEGSLTACLISKQLEALVSDVKCLEQSLDEVCQDDAAAFSEKRPMQL